MKINRRKALHFLYQVMGAVFIAGCGGGFETVNSPLKAKTDKTSGNGDETNAALGGYGSCKDGDIYGYGHFSYGYHDQYGYGSDYGNYGYGPCSSMDGYSLGRDLSGYEFQSSHDTLG